MVCLLAASHPGLVAAAPALWSMGKPCSIDSYITGCLEIHPDPALLRPGGPEDIDMTVPGGRVVHLHRISVDSPADSARSLIWQGRVHGDAWSNATFAVSGHAFVGYITTSPGSAFRVKRGPGGDLQVQVLGNTARIDVLRDDRYACTIPPPGKAIECDAAAAYDVDVLILVTPGAEQDLRSGDELRAWISLAASRTNQSLAQSGVRHRIRIVGIERLPRYTRITSTQQHMEDLESQAKGFEDLPRLRVMTGADLTIMLVSAAGPALSCPLPAESLGSRVASDHGIAVVPVSLLATEDIFTHEIGHLLGAGHAHTPGVRIESRGWFEQGDTQHPAWRTLMVRDSCHNCPSILYWSTPALPAPGAESRLGIAGKADNASTLNATGCTVSKARDRPLQP